MAHLGLPRERSLSAVKILRENAQQAQLLKQVAGANYIDLKASAPSSNTVSISATTSPVDNDDSASPPRENKPITQSQEFTRPTSSFSSPSLHIDLQIHISSDASFEQIDKIFESISKHLYQHSSNE
ncbi:hypothetical protein [Leptolyngbya sp. 7M]|uniref:hypothetical protein n=1 Tax=Leptolyngbya sp. 7M TaxID=2812896 RepID=UPI001B8D1F78|nr:hypothetical protein [Leptolyngbya sp. 7M]QYO68050.1 hypothetical protein JVX88_15505 [Leptolyngbya sp. 7M]